MRVDAQEYLAMCEETGKLAVWDSEASGLKGDYNSLLCVSVKPFGKDPITFAVKQPGNDQKVAREAAEFLSQFNVWVTYYGKGYDVPMLQTRLLKWGLPRLEKKPHLDVYFLMRSNTVTARRSQAHYLDWLGTKEKKMSLSADVWNMVLENPAKVMPTMVARCESDCAGLEELYKQTKHLVIDISR